MHPSSHCCNVIPKRRKYESHAQPIPSSADANWRCLERNSVSRRASIGDPSFQRPTNAGNSPFPGSFATVWRSPKRRSVALHDTPQPQALNQLWKRRLAAARCADDDHIITHKRVAYFRTNVAINDTRPQFNCRPRSTTVAGSSWRSAVGPAPSRFNRKNESASLIEPAPTNSPAVVARSAFLTTRQL